MFKFYFLKNTAETHKFLIKSKKYFLLNYLTTLRNPNLSQGYVGPKRSKEVFNSALHTAVPTTLISSAIRDEDRRGTVDFGDTVKIASASHPGLVC